MTLLRQVEVATVNGKSPPQACKDAAMTEQTSYRWWKEYGGLKLAQAKRLKELEKENSRLTRGVAELSLEKVKLGSLSIPSWNQIVGWLRNMKTLQESGIAAA